MAKKKKSLYKKIVMVILPVIIAAGGLFVLEKTNVINLYDRGTTDTEITEAEKVNVVDYSPATTTDNEEINARKEDGTIEQTPNVPTTDTTIQITFIANAQDFDGGQLEVRTLLNGITDGTCNLTLSGPTKTVEKSSNVILQNTSYLCEAFIVPYSELENGSWQINLKVTSGDGRTNEAATSTTIN